MKPFLRAKRVSDPLGEEVKALIHGGNDNFVSSGSEHEVGSVLSGHLHGFFFDMDEGFSDDGNVAGDGSDDCETRDGLIISSSSFMLRDRARVRDLLRKMNADRFRKGLLRVVSETTAKFEGSLRSSSSSSEFRRAVMTSLRDDYNYNAGICKVRWESDGKVKSGNYEYIDVIRSSSGDSCRYIVDMDFAGEFQIARPTEEYAKLILELPTIYVGTPEEVRKIVRVIGDAAKRSMGINKLHVPPWRRIGYMHNKWLGSYKRTTNPVASGEPQNTSDFGIFQCRELGYPPGRILADQFAFKCMIE